MFLLSIRNDSSSFFTLLIVIIAPLNYAITYRLVTNDPRVCRLCDILKHAFPTILVQQHSCFSSWPSYFSPLWKRALSIISQSAQQCYILKNVLRHLAHSIPTAVGYNRTWWTCWEFPSDIPRFIGVDQWDLEIKIETHWRLLYRNLSRVIRHRQSW